MAFYKIDTLDESITGIKEISMEVYSKNTSNRSILHWKAKGYTAYRKAFGVKVIDSKRESKTYFISKIEELPYYIRMAILKHERKQHAKYMRSRGFD